MWSKREVFRWAFVFSLACVITYLLPHQSTQADEREIDLEHVKLEAPEKWTKSEPRSRIVAYEFAAPAKKDDPADGRVTFMRAGGSVDANINRWKGQFSDAKYEAKVSKSEIQGAEVHIVDMAGTFNDRPRGPFGPSVKRKDYRMLAAIIVVPKKAQYFVKFYGPQKTVTEYEGDFMKMIKGMEKGK